MPRRTPWSAGPRSVVLLFAGAALLTGARATRHAPALSLSSSAFQAGGAIPAEYTCDGDNVSPPLAWTGVPSGAKSLALIVDDPDAPDPKAPTITWVHWVLYDIPPSATGLPRAVDEGSLPEGTRQGTSNFEQTGYGGPCPPVGRHRYFFKLYALDTVLPDLHEPDKARLVSAMRGHIIGQAELIGTYQRSKQ